MKKKTNRLRLFSIVMIFSMLTCMLPNQVYANTEEVLLDDSQFNVETIEEVTDVEESTWEAPEVVEETTEEVAPVMETVEEEIAEEPQEDMEEEVNMPAFSQTQSFEQATVTITANEGVLPEGTTATITELNYEDDVQDVLDAELVQAGNGSVCASMYDVVLYDRNGNVIQPNGEVTISVSGIEMDIPEEYEDLITYQAVRINDDETLTVLKNNLDMNQSTNQFNNNHFTAVGIAAVANIDAMEAAMMDETLFKSYDEPNGYRNNAINHYIVKDGVSYIAYCFNYERGFPGTGNDYAFTYPDATEEQFYELAKKGTAIGTGAYNPRVSQDLLKLRVMNVVYAGYPYNKSGTDMIAKIKEVCNVTDDAQAIEILRWATQWVIWYYTDDSDNTYISPTDNKSNTPGNIIKYLLWEYAENATSYPEGMILDLYGPKNTTSRRQNLLVTRIPKGTVPVTPKENETGSGSGTVQAIIKAKKTIDNGNTAIGNNVFKFELYDANGKKISEAQNDENGDIVFPAITGLGVGTYTYTIKEVGTVAGFENDTSVKTVKVTVTAHDVQTFDSSKVYYAQETDTFAYYVDVNAGNNGIRMYCTYEASSGPQSGSASEQTYKAVINPATITVGEGNMVQGNPYGSSDALKTNLKKIFYYFETTDAKNQGFEDVDLQKIVWKATGDEGSGTLNKNYSINGKAATNSTAKLLQNILETTEVPDGYNLVFFIPTGTQANKHSQPLATGYGTVLTYENNQVPTFNNTTTTTAPEGTSVELSASKTLEGKALEAGQFTFTLTGEGQNQTKTNDADGNVKFDKIDYTKAGTYTYTVKETAGQAGGITYDGSVYTVTVTVADNGNGQLVATQKIQKDSKDVKAIEFKNTYAAKKTSATLEAKKTLSGRALAAEEFSFELTAVKDAPMPENAEAKNDKDGNVSFGTIEYTKAGTYEYKITENAGDLGGVQYDTAEHTAKVVVKDNGDGTLSATVTYDNGSTTKPEFKNTYSAKKTSATLEAKKTLSGRALAAEEFSFELTAVKDAPMPENAEAKNDKAGNVSFGTIEYTKAGTYEYKITEKTGDLGGVQYDTTEHTAKVVVKDNGDGTLSATVTYDNGSTTKPEFKNTYSTSEVTVTLEANKTLTGRTLAAEEFSFELAAVTEKAPMPENTEAKNDKDGNVSFGAIEYTQTGTYEYKITEKAGNLGGIKYDTAAHTAKVVVKDNGDGTLSATVKYDGDSTEKPVFTNTYSTEKTSATLEAKKTLTGRALAAEEFSFELAAVTEKAPMPKNTKAKNDKAGNVSFGAIEYTQAGTYEYKITENAGDLGGIKYDTTEHKAKVVVKDNGDGTLSATVTYDNESTTKPEFKNTYSTSEVTVTLEANKTLTQGTLKGDDYSFELKALDNAPLPEQNMINQIISLFTQNDSVKAKNDEEGKVSFGTITYNATGTYQYKVSEVIPDNTTGIAYDNTVYIVTVEVTDNGEGKLVADVTIDGATSIDFTNTKIHFNVNKTELGSGEEVEGAVIEVVDEDGNVVDSWTSKKDETHDFGSELEAGKSYTLKETVAPQGYNYVSEIKFTVKEDGSIDVDMPNTKDEDGNVTYLVEDSKLHFTVNKTELGSGKEVEGAVIEVVDEDENVVDSWTSKKGETHDFGSKLEAGKSYTLKETVAPQGYNYVSEIKFTVKEDGSIDVDMPNTTDKDGNVTYLVEDSKLHFTVNKTDLDSGEELDGSQIQILTKDGKVVDSWTSVKGETHDFGSKLEAGNTYILRENVAPQGYNYATDIEFTIEKDGTINHKMPKSVDENGNDVHLVKDSKLHFNVNKTDLDSGKEVEGAVIEVVDEDGKVVDSWTSKKDETHDFGSKLEAGKSYTLKETVAPDGYSYVTDIKFKVEKDGTITTEMTKTTDKDGNVTYLVEDEITKVKVSKVDVNGGKELEGAEIQILDEDGKVVEEWTSTKDAHEVTGLTVGKTYTLRETVAPDGYSVTSDTTFVLNEKGKVDTTKTTTTVNDGTLLVEDTITKVSISKVDVNGGEELEGAQIQILDENGKVVEEWTSTKDAHEVTGLTVGKTYTLRETVAPDGYSVTSDTTFVLDEKGKVDTTKTTTTVKDGVLLVEDKVTEVKISKVDITNGKELEGAVIQILDKDGKVVAKWVSTKEVHVVKGLKTGQTYTLREKVAPKGYEITADTTFELNADGTINTSKTTTKVKDGILLVEDSKTPTPGKPGGPSTGTNNGMKFYGSLFTVSMAGAAWMLALRKKRED